MKLAIRSLATMGLTLALLGCGGTGASALPSLPAVSVPSVPPASASVEELARQACPADVANECVKGVVDAASSGLPAALCIFPDNKWSVVTPGADAAVGSTCGTDNTGTIRILISK